MHISVLQQQIASAMSQSERSANAIRLSSSLIMQAGQSAHNSPDAAGAVQKELSGFLRDCPGGVVVVDNAQKLSPALLPVFINALSEQGSFEVYCHALRLLLVIYAS